MPIRASRDGARAPFRSRRTCWRRSAWPAISGSCPRGEPWWVELPPDANTIYLSFSRYPPEAEFQQRCLELGRLLDQSGARRLIIDLRRNEGGDLTLAGRFLLPVLQGCRALDHVGGMCAIIGPGTFSAAMVNALDLRLKLNATLVGEPTGIDASNRSGKTSGQGETRCWTGSGATHPLTMRAAELLPQTSSCRRGLTNSNR